MEVIVDKRIELMAVIQTMNGYWDNLALQYSGAKLFICKYKDDVYKYFGKYKNHTAVKLYSTVCGNIEDISTFTNLALCFSNPPDLNNIANLEDNINSLAVQHIQYGELINKLNQFYKDSDFEYFLQRTGTNTKY
jgi:hypothetical protein